MEEGAQEGGSGVERLMALYRSIIEDALAERRYRPIHAREAFAFQLYDMAKEGYQKSLVGDQAFDAHLAGMSAVIRAAMQRERTPSPTKEKE